MSDRDRLAAIVNEGRDAHLTPHEIADALLAAGCVIGRLQDPIDGACNRPRPPARDLFVPRCIKNEGHEGGCW